jgi:hypothetical protein
MFFMTADRQPLPPNRAAGRKAPNELAYSGSSHALKAAGLVFSGVALSLADLRHHRVFIQPFAGTDRCGHQDRFSRGQGNQC